MIGSNSLPLVPTTVPPTCDVAFNFIFNIFKFMVAQLTYIPCPGSVQCAVCIIILYICCQRLQALQNSVMPLYICIYSPPCLHIYHTYKYYKLYFFLVLNTSFILRSESRLFAFYHSEGPVLFHADCYLLCVLSFCIKWLWVAGNC